jgi:HSP20 family protein
MFPKPFEAMQREVENLFDNALSNGNGATSWFAPISMWEEEGAWCVDIDLPGVKQEDLDVTVEKNTLRVIAERKETPEDRRFWHQERTYGRIERLITLPETVDTESIQAELKDGVLHLQLAKRPESQPKKISIKAS